MKKIVQLLIVFISMATFQTVQGQYLNSRKLREYNRSFLNRYFATETLIYRQYGDLVDGHFKLREQYLNDSYFYLSVKALPSSSNYLASSTTKLEIQGEEGWKEIPIFSSGNGFVAETLRHYHDGTMKVEYEPANGRGPNLEIFWVLGYKLQESTYAFPRQASNETSVKYINIPIHIPLKSEGDNTYLPLDEKIKIYGRYFTFFSPEEERYYYQYRFVGGSNVAWEDFDPKGVYQETLPSGESRSVINISATDIFGSLEEATKHIGKKVQIRVASIKYEGEYLSWSEPTLPLTIVPSSPTIENVSVDAPKCFEGEGTAMLRFSRSLYPKERLMVSGINVEGAIGTDVTHLLQNGLRELRASVSKGAYVIKLIGEYNGAPTYSGGLNHEYSFSVSSPEKFSFDTGTVSSTNEVCYGEGGSVRFQGATGGTPPYFYQIVPKGKPRESYQWKAFTTSTGFEHLGLAPGEYYVYLRDKNGCRSLDSNQEERKLEVRILGATALELLAKPSRGAVSLAASGGKPPYEYELYKDAILGTPNKKGRLESKVAENIPLEGGTYYAVLKDALGCSTQTTFVAASALKVVSSTFSEISCKGEASGSITLEVAGGQPPYFYELSSVSGKRTFTTNRVTIPNLKAGSYSVRITDSYLDGTSTETRYVLSEPQLELRLTADIIMPKSYGATDGGIVATVIGGTPTSSGTYRYEWRKDSASGSVISTGISTRLGTGFEIAIGNLGKGRYHLLVSDKLGCEVSGVYELSEPPSISTVTHTDISCYGEATGSIRLNVLGGSMPYSYRMGGSGSLWKEFSGNTLVLGNLSAGTYTLEVRDAIGTMAMDRDGNPMVVTRVISAPASALEVIETLTNVSGNGLTNGKIVLQVQGGTPNASGYTIRLMNKQGVQLTPTATNFTSGVHRLEFSNLPAGEYQLRVTDANYTQNSGAGCMISKTFVIAQPDALQLILSVVKGISCHSSIGITSDLNNNGLDDSTEDGSIRAQVSGGALPYVYAWSEKRSGGYISIGTNTTVLSNLKEGTYRLEVTDANGDKVVREVTLSSPPALQWQLNSDSSGCAGSASGKASIRVQGGTPPYQYLWSNGATEATIENLSSGTYSVRVADANGCYITDSVVVGSASAIVLTQEQITQPSCEGASDGGIVVTASGGSGVYTFRWENGSSLPYRAGLSAGTYTLTITDGTPCGFFEKSFVITNPEAIVLNVPKELTLCQGDTQELNIAIADAQAQYQWLHNGRVISNQSQLTITQAGTYQAKVTNGNGCQATASIEVKTSQMSIDVNFLVTSYAFYDYAVRLVNVGGSLDTFAWEVPTEAEIISESEKHIDIKFPQAGAYKIGLLGRVGDCQKVLYKTIVVDKDTFGKGLDDMNKESNVRRFVITPNPNKGNFRALINLHNPQPIRLRFYDMLGKQVLPQREVASATDFEIPISHPFAAGQYLVVLEAGNEIRVEKMIVN